MNCMFTILVSVTIILLIRKYRRRIGYFFLRLRKGHELDDRECAADAFVIYSDTDRFWVHDVMVPKLEQEMGLTLCIHYRDFLPGKDIDQQILDSMNNSRKTIAVLSEAFLDSHWCNYELRVARHRLQSEGIDVIIPIILSDLPKEKKSTSIKQILSEKTYINWETEDEAQEYFWKKLRLAALVK